MKKILKLISLLLVLTALPLTTLAATYNLPAAIGTGPFSNCSFTSGTTYTCNGSLSLSQGTIVNVTSNMTLNVTNSMAIGENVTFGTTGYTFNVVVSGSASIQENSVTNANISAGGSIQVSQATVNGNINSSGSIQIDQSAITGNVTAAGSLAISSSTVNGTCSPNNAACAATVTVPTVATSAATAVATTGATLNGTVSSNGASTTVTFDYGTTTGYGSTATAAASPLAAGATNSAVSATLTGLTCNTLYHFRVKGVNSAGTANGGDLTFTTSACQLTSINTASANPTTTNTAVSWTVVFAQSVTGVAAANFSLVQSGGATGATITSVTGSGTTYTVTANSGAAYGSLGLNMVNVTGITPAISTTMPFTGQVYTIAAPMICTTDTFSTGVLDTSLWSVATISGPYTPAVINAGTVGTPDYRMRLTDTNAAGNEATVATIKKSFPGAGNKVVLEIDYFAYGGSGADGMAVTFSDSSVSSITGAFGGSLGYAQKNNASCAPLTPPCNGFGGGWLGIGVDEYGNFPNPTEGRNGYPTGWTAPTNANVAAGFYPNNISIRGSGSGVVGYSLLASTGTLATPVSPTSGAGGATPYRYRFTIDHSNNVNAWVSVDRDTTGTGNSYVSLVPPFDVIAANSGQSTVPAGWTLSFTGSTGGATNNHEFKRISVCANSVVNSVDHVTINAPATAMTNTAVPITIVAHTATHTAMNGAGTISLSTSTGLGNWTLATGTGTFVAGAANSGTATYTYASGESSVTFNFTHATAGTVTFSVNGAAGMNLLATTPAGEKANVTAFSVPGYAFTSGPCTNGQTIGTGTCLTPTWSPQVAGQNSANIYITHLGGAGVPATYIGGTLSLKFGLSCYDPAANAGKQATFAGQTLPVCTSNSAQPTAWSPTINFPSGSVSIGPYNFNYPDVGKVALWMSDTVAPPTVGTSGAFTVKPGGFVLSAIKQTAVPQLANPAAANATGTKFVKAGEAFSVTVTATTCPTASASCTVAGATTPNYGQESIPENVKLTPALTSGLGLTSSGTLAGAFGAFTAGVATGSNFTWSEVGIITLTPSIFDANYLTSGDVAGTVSGNVGRFYPDHFDTATIDGCLACGFTYEKQNFTTTITAKNVANNATLNYSGGFAKAVTLTDANAVAGTLKVGAASPAVVAAAFSATTGMATETTTNYTFTTSPNSQTIKLRATDADGVTSSTGTEGTANIRSGRIMVSNAVGSELLSIAVTATAQYYNGTSWVTSITDGVTSLVLAATYAVGTGTTTPSFVTPTDATCLPYTNGKLCKGVATIYLSSPGVAGNAVLAPTVGTTVCPSPALCLPVTSGMATFGVYQGRREFIYLRENY